MSMNGFVTNMHLQLFVPGMLGSMWFSVQGIVGTLDLSSGRIIFLHVGVVAVENETFSPLDHYSVRLYLYTLLAQAPPGNALVWACFKLGTTVSEQH